MANEKYVLNLLEEASFMGPTKIGYWTGTKHIIEDVCIPGVKDSKYDEDVKVYSSRKRAENAVDKLKDKFSYVHDAVIETLD